MARLIDPVIADLQTEHSQAVRSGHMWRSGWVRLAGYVAFAKVLVMCEWSAVEDTGPLVRAAGFSLGAIAILTGVLLWIPYQRFVPGAPIPVDALRIGIFLLPQALAISIPTGLMLGISIGVAGRKVSVRLANAMIMTALACSVASVANMGWLLPNANQAFRVEVARRIGLALPLAKGDSELTFGELDRLIERRSSFPVGSAEWDDANRLRVGYHAR